MLGRPPLKGGKHAFAISELTVRPQFMAKLNWKTISYDIVEARDQLQDIERRVKKGAFPSEEEFQIMLQHVYLHLNFAWNARHKTTKEYASLSDADFDAWKKYPHEIDD